MVYSFAVGKIHKFNPFVNFREAGENLASLMKKKRNTLEIFRTEANSANN